MVNDCTTKKCWNLNIYLRTLFYFIFNWSVYTLISSTKSGPWPEWEYPVGHEGAMLNEALRQKYLASYIITKQT